MNKLEERFWSKVDAKSDDECWEWMAGKFQHGGYGQFNIDGKICYAHRVAYELAVGEIPEGLCACHKCDNPSCVNPSHLFIGTHADNMEDRNKKGRTRVGWVPGEKNGMSKLTSCQAAEIRSRSTGRRGEKAALAKEYGVSPSTIGLIFAWQDVVQLNDNTRPPKSGCKSG